MDLFSRKIVGWAAKPTIHQELVLEVIMKAVRSRRTAQGGHARIKELNTGATSGGASAIVTISNQA